MTPPLLGLVQFHKNIKTSPDALLQAIRPYLDDLVIAVECIFSWYWIADFWEDNNIKFILGHALYMKAIHAAKPRMIKSIHIKLQVLQEVVHSYLYLCFGENRDPHGIF